MIFFVIVCNITFGLSKFFLSMGTLKISITINKGCRYHESFIKT
jgi:hypothetical protein